MRKPHHFPIHETDSKEIISITHDKLPRIRRVESTTIPFGPESQEQDTMASFLPNDQRGKDALIVGGTVLAVGISSALLWANSRSRQSDESSAIPTAHEQLIEGGTPLIKLKRVEKMIGRSVFVKMESMNPGGTGKDRAALNMIRMAEKEGNLPPPAEASSTKDDEDTNTSACMGSPTTRLLPCGTNTWITISACKHQLLR